MTQRHPIAHRRPLVPTEIARREHGSVLIVVSLCLTVIVLCTALTIDLGRVSTTRRDLQNVADAAALDLVRLLDGRTAGQLTADPLWNQTLNASLARNDFSISGDRHVTVSLGHFNELTEVWTSVASTGVPTAVKVAVEDRVEYSFAPGGSTTSREAVGSQDAAAGIKIGSFAGRFETANSALLSGLLGDALGISALSYNGLVDTHIGLDVLATELNLSLANPNELLSTDFTLANFLVAQIAILTREGKLTQASLLQQVLLQLDTPNLMLNLGDLMQIGAGSMTSALDSQLNVLDILTATAFIANGNSFLSVPNVGFSLPGGIVTQNTSVQVIESPRIAFGGVGTRVQTAQVRMLTSLTISLPSAAWPMQQTTLSFEFQAAPASATIAAIRCGSPKSLETDVTTAPQSAVMAASTGLWVNVPFLGRVKLAQVALSANLGQNPTVGAVDFVFPPDLVGVPKTYAGSILDVGGASIHVDKIDVLFLSLGGLVNGLVSGLLNNTLMPILSQLDTLLVRPLMKLLGVTAPGADVTPLGTGCTGARLIH